MTQYMYLKSYKPCKVSLICEPGGKFMLHVRGREEFFDSSDERMMIYYLYGVNDIETFGAYLCMAAKLIPLKGKELEVVANEFKSQRKAIPIVKYPLEHIPSAADPVNGLVMKTRWGTFRMTAEQEKALIEAIQADPTRESLRGYKRIIKTFKKFNRGYGYDYYHEPTYEPFLNIHGIVSLRKRELTSKEKYSDITHGVLLGPGTFIGQMIVGGFIFNWGDSTDLMDSAELSMLKIIAFLAGIYLMIEPILVLVSRSFRQIVKIWLFAKWFWPLRAVQEIESHDESIFE